MRLGKEKTLLPLPGFKLGIVGVPALNPVNIANQLFRFISIPPPRAFININLKLNKIREHLD